MQINVIWYESDRRKIW